VPHNGRYGEVFNSDSGYYGGANLGNGLGVHAAPTPWHGQPQSIQVSLPPLAGVIFAPG
jgi:1,4-alpha-glucan branching enzyme